ncbi:negative regulation of activation-induced cell death of T cells, partial [Pristimantis euphronides]
MSGGKKRSGFQITSVTTDYLPSSPVSPVPVERSPSPPNGPRSPPTSRFRLVRLDQGPLGGGHRYQKGRWTCVDFYNLEMGVQHRAGAGHSLDSGLPRSTPVSPLQLSPGAGAKGQLTPRSQGAPIFAAVTNKEPIAQLSPPQHPISPIIVVQKEGRPTRPVSDVFNERLLLARSVFSIGDDNESDSISNSAGAIDNKIEQAM